MQGRIRYARNYRLLNLFECRLCEVEWRIEPGDSGQRLDKHLALRLTELSRSRLQVLIRDGHVTLNGRPTKASAAL